MSTFNYLLIVHLLGASIWVGGHLFLLVVILPKTLVAKDVKALLDFESKFEKIGMPALILQIITGISMAYKIIPDTSHWFTFKNDISVLITLKFALLFATLIIAMHARFRVIPKLSVATLPWFAVHITLITLISIGFVIVGTLFRTGL